LLRLLSPLQALLQQLLPSNECGICIKMCPVLSGESAQE
jgi:hypothetical protein